MSDYRPVFDDRAGSPRILRWLVAVALLIGAGAAADRWMLPHPDPVAEQQTSATTAAPASPSGEVGQRFPATVRGAGDATADLETRLAAAVNQPADEARTRIAALLAPSATGLADQLAAGSATSPTPAAIRQTVVVRVWADGSGDPTVLPVGARVPVQTYGLALLGAGAENPSTTPGAGSGDGPAARLTGGWAVHDLTVELTDAGWRLADLQLPVPAPAPDVRGTIRDGGPRDPQLLTRVLGPDSWAPGTTS